MSESDSAWTAAASGTKGAAALALAVASICAAQAQENQLEEIIVTGTSIRGEAPVGQNVIAIDRVAIEQTGAQSVQQILQDVPQITGFGSDTQGQYGSFDGSGSYAPTIHSLGASASNGTLTLVNGRRLPLTGLSHTLADPSIIPPAAIERVEILPDGASATYGSDAVAGVLNFITRSSFDGFEVSAQTGFADDYDSHNVNLVGGTTWDSGSLVAAYSYSYRSNLAGRDRTDLVRQDLSALGGRNWASYRCYPATLRVGGTRYDAPYGAGDTISSAPCDTTAYSDRLPDELRNSALIGFSQEVSDRLTFGADFVYSKRTNESATSRGSISTTVYGPGSTPPPGASINPFFVAPPGVTSASIEFDANELLGPGGAVTESSQAVFFVSPTLEFALNDDWVLTAGGTFGEDRSNRSIVGTLCSYCAREALAGDGLTTQTALNAWGAAGAAAAGTDTSAATLAFLTDSNQLDQSRQTLADVSVKVDGSLGRVKLAFGAEQIRYNIQQDVSRPGATGPASTAAQTIHTDIPRDVSAIFAEALIPISATVDLSLAARHDDYSDFGGTTNPKISLQWQPDDQWRIRASWSESFTAPALTSRGEPGTGRTTESGWGAAPPFTSGFIGPDFSDPRTADFLATVPGCAQGCVINTPGGVTGAWVTGGNDDLKAAEGESWSLGFDRTGESWDIHLTYWDSLYEGMVTAPVLSNIIAVPGLNDRVILLPTAAEIAAATTGLPQSSVLPPNVYFLWSFQQVNAFNIDAAGIDLDVQYHFDLAGGQLTLGLATSRKIRFDQQAGTGGPWQDFLNVDANTTFSSLKSLSVGTVRWNSDKLSANVSIRHTGGYRKLNDPLQQSVDAYTTVDFHGAFDFTNAMQVFVDVQNLFEEDPPFYNANGGYNASESSILGRYITVGFRKTW